MLVAGEHEARADRDPAELEPEVAVALLREMGSRIGPSRHAAASKS